MTQVNLRQAPGQATPLTVAQGDESLIHLSNFQSISSNAALFTGGKYLTSGNIIVNLPADGNEFEITVASGTVQLNTAAGDTVDGATNPVIGAGPNRKYWKIGTDWRLQASPSVSGSGATTNVTASTTINTNNREIFWVDSATPVTLTIPANLPLNHTFWVVRPVATSTVIVVPTAPEAAINLATGGTDPAGFLFNQSGVAIFTKLANGWHVAANQ